MSYLVNITDASYEVFFDHENSYWEILSKKEITMFYLHVYFNGARGMDIKFYKESIYDLDFDMVYRFLLSREY